MSNPETDELFRDRLITKWEEDNLDPTILNTLCGEQLDMLGSVVGFCRKGVDVYLTNLVQSLFGEGSNS